MTVTYPVTVTVSRDTGRRDVPAGGPLVAARGQGRRRVRPLPDHGRDQPERRRGRPARRDHHRGVRRQADRLEHRLPRRQRQPGGDRRVDAFTNNDRTNPPNAVAITITEIAETITATTRFPRDVTTGYSSSGAGGYVWSSQISDSGTLADKGIQEVAGVSVSTVSAAAGVVWEQGDEFYVRGVPTVPGNGGAISLGKASGGGYARRPFLLLDDFAKSGKPGNHVLLEPDPSVDAYHVRPVTLDPVTAAPTWDLDEVRRDVRAGGPCPPPRCTPPGAWSPSTPTAGGSASCSRRSRRSRHRRRPRRSRPRPPAPVPGRPAELTDRRGGDQSRHDPGARAGSAAGLRLRPQRQPRALLRHRAHRGRGHAVHVPLVNRAATSTSPSTAPTSCTSSTTPATAPRPPTTASTSTRRSACSWPAASRASTSRTSPSTTGATSSRRTTTRSPTP